MSEDRTGPWNKTSTSQYVFDRGDLTMDQNTLDRTGVYIAYPTSPTLESIYKLKNYKTKVPLQQNLWGPPGRSGRDPSV
jgi:hypothetical protein